MTGPDGLPVLVLLAFQVWDAFGWAGQALFALRVLQQWYASERAGRSHVTGSFWWISLAATALVFVYMLHRKDPVFVVGYAVNAFVYARNLRLGAGAGIAAPPRGPWTPLIAGLALSAVVVLAWLAQDQVFREQDPGPWLAVGVAGQTLWTSRFIVQWAISERRGESVLPPSFFWVSIVGAVLLLIYAVARSDWVMTAAFALNPVPYARNLILLRREGSARR